jgi:hypothetical protein
MGVKDKGLVEALNLFDSSRKNPKPGIHERRRGPIWPADMVFGANAASTLRSE